MPPVPPGRDATERHLISAARIIAFIDGELAHYATAAERELVMTWVSEHERCRREQTALAVSDAIAALRAKLE